MSTRYIFFLLCMINIARAIEHQNDGTAYGQQGVLAYEKFQHGPDGALFLDGYIRRSLENVSGKVVLDAGCGAGPWSHFAGRNNAQVYGVDIQAAMIERAAAACSDLPNCKFTVGNVAALPYQDDFFDLAISINVGCNLPSDILEAHFDELFRTLKENGLLIFTVPISLKYIFTEAKNPEEVKSHIGTVLQKINSHSAPSSVLYLLIELTEVYRASFAVIEGEAQLIEPSMEIAPSAEIYRKIPGLVVPNFFHDESEYLELISKKGFSIVKIEKPKFVDENARQKCNENGESTFGKEYVQQSPFVIFTLKKDT